MRSGKLFICLFVLMVAFMVRATPAWAADSLDEQFIQMTIGSPTDGGDIVIEGGMTDMETGAAGAISVFSFAFRMQKDYQPSTGESVGQTKFSAIKVLKKLDIASAGIMAASLLDTTYNITIKFFTLVSLEPYQLDLSYTFTLTDAKIVGVTMFTPEQGNLYENPFGDGTKRVIIQGMEYLTITYRSIGWSSPGGGSGAGFWGSIDETP